MYHCRSATMDYKSIDVIGLAEQTSANLSVAIDYKTIYIIRLLIVSIV